MPAGWRAVTVEYWPARVPGQYNEADTGEIAIVQTLAPNAKDPTTDQLAAIQATFARHGGYASWPRILARYWYGIPQLTPEQMKALAGVP
jgi:hypothetical protein